MQAGSETGIFSHYVGFVQQAVAPAIVKLSPKRLTESVNSYFWSYPLFATGYAVFRNPVWATDAATGAVAIALPALAQAETTKKVATFCLSLHLAKGAYNVYSLVRSGDLWCVMSAWNDAVYAIKFAKLLVEEEKEDVPIN